MQPDHEIPVDSRDGKVVKKKVSCGRGSCSSSSSPDLGVWATSCLDVRLLVSSKPKVSSVASLNSANEKCGCLTLKPPEALFSAHFPVVSQPPDDS